MSNYFTLKNRTILNPPTGTDLGSGNNKFSNVYIGNQLTVGTTTVDSTSIGSIKISGITYPGDDTAADTAGGQTIAITGSGFVAGASVIIDGAAVGVVTVVSGTQITFTAPAKATGSYSLYVINPDGATAISVVGIQFSGVPAWVTAAGSLSTIYEGDVINTQISATGDAPVIYSLVTGSLPAGLTLAGNGRILGTANALASSTTYNFTAKATDYQNQDTDRAFSYTVNPESVTFNTPAGNQTYSNLTSDSFSLTLNATSAAGRNIAYTANALPTGLSLSGATISGTLSGTGSTSSLITATVVGSVKTATRTLRWTVTSPPIQIPISLLVVGGGGNGGGLYTQNSNNAGGGGGSGGALSDTYTVNTGITSFTITVGDGSNDRTSSITSASFNRYAFAGGQGGASGGNAGQPGGRGSAGGGGARGDGITSGGGSGGAGGNFVSPGGGGGGSYSGGGGGGGGGGGYSGSGYGPGGGGGGRDWSGTDYNNIGTSWGEGGAGGTSNNGTPGIVAIKYADTYPAAATTTGSPTITVTGGYRVYKWTSSGSITF